MPPVFLLPETTVSENGDGPVVDIGDRSGSSVVLTLGILDIVEQESLDVAIRGSADGEDWEAKPLRAFPQKFYKGTAQIVLDLSAHPEVKFLRAEWTVGRWGVGSQTPMFKIYVAAETLTESSAKSA